MLDQLATAARDGRAHRLSRSPRRRPHRLTEKGRERPAEENDAAHARSGARTFAALNGDELLAGAAVLERLSRLYGEPLSAGCP